MAISAELSTIIAAIRDRRKAIRHGLPIDTAP
jgi:hypothetical protein